MHQIFRVHYDCVHVGDDTKDVAKVALATAKELLNPADRIVIVSHSATCEGFPCDCKVIEVTPDTGVRKLQSELS
jgi:hypothetical protein